MSKEQKTNEKAVNYVRDCRHSFFDGDWLCNHPDAKALLKTAGAEAFVCNFTHHYPKRKCRRWEVFKGKQ